MTDDHVLHCGNRVIVSTLAGGAAGLVIALFRNHPPVSTAGFTALSCGMAGTVCLGLERLTFVGMDTANPDLKKQYSRRTLLLASHAVGGLLGGAVLGKLFNQRAANGIVLFLPLMTLIGYGESRFQDMCEEVVRDRMKKNAPQPIFPEFREKS